MEEKNQDYSEIRQIALEYKYDFKDPEIYVKKLDKGLNEEKVYLISKIKNEPDWMTEFRLNAYRIFVSKPMPTWGNTELLNSINFDDIYYYIKPTDKQKTSWDEVPEYIKKTFESLGIPEAERKFLAGVTAQYESEVVYHSIS
jgi:Fe-S cluster assembly protein SufB